MSTVISPLDVERLAWGVRPAAPPLLIRGAAPYGEKAVDVLLEATPKGVDLTDIRTHLLERGHVHDVHDLHVPAR